MQRPGRFAQTSRVRPDPGFVDLLERGELGSHAGTVLAHGLAEVNRWAKDWGLEIVEPAPGATTSLVFRCARNGEELFLKIPLIGEEKDTGSFSARAFSGRGGIKIVESDDATGALLMPFVRPEGAQGVTLADRRLPDADALIVCADLVRNLHRASFDLDAYRSLPQANWFAYLDRADDAAKDEADETRLDLARRLLAALRATTTSRVLLYGDLHHFNILRHGSDWVAIDPKGLLDDPAFEAAAFIRNEIPEGLIGPYLEEFLLRRINQFADLLGYPAERIWAWSAADTIQSSVHQGSLPTETWTQVSYSMVDIGRSQAWFAAFGLAP